jgi:hypothetical protein
MSSVFRNGPPWFVMFMTRCTAMCSPLQFATCNLNPQKLNVHVDKTKLSDAQVWSCKPHFKGFMANSAHANWNVVCIMYSSRNAYVKMVDKE